MNKKYFFIGPNSNNRFGGENKKNFFPDRSRGRVDKTLFILPLEKEYI